MMATAVCADARCRARTQGRAGRGKPAPGGTTSGLRECESGLGRKPVPISHARIMGTGFLGRNSKSCDELALSFPAGIVSSSACMGVQEAVDIVFGQGRDGCSSCSHSCSDLLQEATQQSHLMSGIRSLCSSSGREPCKRNKTLLRPRNGR